MGFRMIKIEELYEIYRLMKSGLNKSAISKERNIDRKTVREYTKLFLGQGIMSDNTVVTYEEFVSKIQKELPTREKRKSKQEELINFKETIEKLFKEDESIRIDTVYRIIKTKYSVEVSYDTFRRYIINENLRKTEKKDIIRIELPVGEEIQIDYGKVGKIYDTITKKNKVVYAFIGILSYSRLPYVEFVYTQNQQSFVMSHIRMFEYYGGVSEYVSIDNLKSGVLKAAL